MRDMEGNVYPKDHGGAGRIGIGDMRGRRGGRLSQGVFWSAGQSQGQGRTSRDRGYEDGS
jgi:hypothetical protein